MSVLLVCVCAGAIHPGHAAPLHLQPSRDDPVGEGHLRSIATTGKLVSGWTGPHLGTRSLAFVPGQVSEKCCNSGCGLCAGVCVWVIPVVVTHLYVVWYMLCVLSGQTGV